MEITKERVVFLALTNTDLTEGKGTTYPLRISTSKAEAIRSGMHCGVQGSNCPVQEGVAYEVGGVWYVPGRLTFGTNEDLAKDRAREELESVIEKAKTLGVTDEEIKVLTRKQKTNKA